MLNIGLFKYMRGYVRFSGLGGFQEKFIDELHSRKVKIWGIRHKGGYIYGKIKPSHYAFAARAARRHGFKLRVQKRVGLPFKLYRFRKRPGILVGLFAFIFMLTALSNRIWQIEVVGNERLSTTEILTVMGELGVSAGMSGSTLGFNKIKRQAIMKMPEAAWINMNKKGSRLVIEISELAEDLGMIDTSVPANIVSLRDAQIIDTQVLAGTLVTPKGSAVKKGGIIVSGIVIDTQGNVLYKHAQANIQAEFIEKNEFYVPYFSTGKRLSDNKEIKDYLVFLNNTIPLFWAETAMSDYHYNEILEEPKLFGLELPFKIKKGIYTEYEEVEYIKTAEEVVKELEQKRDEYIENFFSEYEIVDIKTELIPDDLGITLRFEAILRGNIAKTEEIQIMFDKN